MLHSAEFIVNYEQPITSFWQGVINNYPAAEPCYVLDIGSNGGFFTLLSRAMGCRVMAVDAQPRCLERLQSSAAMNGFVDGIEPRWTAVSSKDGVVLQAGATKCSGLWGVTDQDWINKESEYNVDVRGTPLEKLVQGWLPDGKSVALMKVDVEGSEVAVWQTALPLLRAKRVAHIVAEVVPGRVDGITPFEEVKTTITAMYESGYACRIVEGGANMDLATVLRAFDPASKSARDGLSPNWVCSLQQG